MSVIDNPNIPLEIRTVRQRLLDAAEQVVRRDGVSSLTLEAVAREASVSKGGLLYHFPSKSALVVAIVERLAQRCDAEHGKALEGNPDLSAGTFTRAYLRARLRPRQADEAVIQTAVLAAAGTDPQYLQPFRSRLVDWQKKLETDGLDPALATIVRLAIDGLCLGELFNMPVPQGEFRQRVIDRLIALTKEPQNEDRDAK